MVWVRKRPQEHNPTLCISFLFEYPISQSCKKKKKEKKNPSLFGRLHAFPSILLLRINPKRVGVALLSTATANPEKRVLLARF